MKTILLLIVLLALPVRATWAQFFSNLADCKTAEDSAKNLIQSGDLHWVDPDGDISLPIIGEEYPLNEWQKEQLDIKTPDTLIHLYLTPDEYKRLMEMLEPAPVIIYESLKPDCWEYEFDSVFKKADGKFNRPGLPGILVED